MKKRILRGAIWDIDGTLIDSMPVWRDLGARYLRRRGLVPERGLGDILFPMTTEEAIAYVKKRYALRESAEEIRRSLIREVGIFYREQVPLKSGAGEVLALMRQRGIPMMLATVGDPALARAALIRLGVLGYFEGMLTCRELGTSKKEPLIYQECARRLGTRIEETVVFEDVYHGIRSAGEAGFITVAVEDRDSAAQKKEIMAEADLYVRDLGSPELREKLEEWMADR